MAEAWVAVYNIIAEIMLTHFDGENHEDDIFVEQEGTGYGNATTMKSAKSTRTVKNGTESIVLEEDEEMVEQEATASASAS